MLAPCLLLLQAAPAPQSGFSVIPLLIILGMGYVLIIRPQNQQRKEQDRMREALKPGDEVVTAGGLFGIVVGLRDQRIQVRISDGVKVEVSRHRIASVIARDED